MKYILVLLMSLFSLQAMAWDYPDEIKCVETRHPHSVTYVYWNCNDGVPFQLPYVLTDGSVGILPSRTSSLCVNGVCRELVNFHATNTLTSNDWEGPGRIEVHHPVGYEPVYYDEYTILAERVTEIPPSGLRHRERINDCVAKTAELARDGDINVTFKYDILEEWEQECRKKLK